MNSRERILTALSHREADRIPRDLGGTESSGMTVYALSRLQNHLRLPGVPKVFDPYQHVAYIDGDLRERFKIDTDNLTPEPRRWIEKTDDSGSPLLLPEMWRERREADGSTVALSADGRVVAKRPKGGFYFDPVNPPLYDVERPTDLDAHRETIRGFDWPSFVNETDDMLRERAKAMAAGDNCTIYNLCCHILAAGQLLRGFENFMVDLLASETMVRKLLDILIESYLERIDRLAPLVREHVDIVLFNDDLGVQKGPMLSPSIYRKLIKPYQKTLFGHAKKSFETPILFHSCGAVRDFIPDLIDAGVDAINPVQISAHGMEPRELKRDFGNDITFWGGGIDTQSVLNRKTPAEVADSVKENVDAFAPGGGFVFCPVHNIQPDVPPENVLAMFEALDEHGVYRTG